MKQIRVVYEAVSINKIMKYQFDNLLGKTKKEIILELGHGFNYYPDSIWTYIIGKTWWGLPITLKICFENDIAISIILEKKKFWK